MSLLDLLADLPAEGRCSARGTNIEARVLSTTIALRISEFPPYLLDASELQSQAA